MTKKRFYKLLRAWLTQTKTANSNNKLANRICTQQKPLKRTRNTKATYLDVWNIITNDGKIAEGIGVKAGVQK